MRLSDAEWRLMQALWAVGPATAREVLDHLGGDPAWAYTTVKTMLSRLADKGALTQRKRGNLTVYRATLTRERAQREAVEALADRAFEGAFGSMVQFLFDPRRLSDSERAELRQMLADAEADDESAP